MIDPRAIIDPGAQLADGVVVEPFAMIGPGVEIGANTWIGAHAVIRGPAKIGRDNRIYQFASIGEAPQDKKYAGEDTVLEVGDRNVIREYCTLNRGTVQGGGVTRVGSDNWIMTGVHVAHDCIVGNQAVFANNVALAGHVQIGDYVILGGYTLIHQFCRIGDYSFTAMGSAIPRDVPPYLLVSGHMARPYGLNTEGLKRRNFSSDVIRNIRRAYKLLYKSGLQLQQACDEIRPLAAQCREVAEFLSFIESSGRGIVR